jgi:hypothetical protein
VKSSATQSVLNQYVAAVDETGSFNRFFFICHTHKDSLAVPDDREDVHLWSGAKLAETVMRVGLCDWVIEKVS